MNFQSIFEVLFNLSYLTIIWVYIYRMFTQSNKDPILHYFKMAFLYLAIGDTFHVGLRSVSHLLGNIDYTITWMGQDIKLIGLGALITAVTVTITYLYFNSAWYHRFRQQKGLYYTILILSMLRIMLLIPTQNNWFTSASLEWTIIRNIPLIITGFMMIYVMYQQGKKESFYRTFSYYIMLSYLFYMPVIFFVKAIPALGMLMIPKTIAYLLMLKLTYDYYYKTT